MENLESVVGSIRSVKSGKKRRKVLIVLIIIILICSFFNRKKILRFFVETKERVNIAISETIDDVKERLTPKKKEETMAVNEEDTEDTVSFSATLVNDKIDFMSKISILDIKSDSVLTSSKGMDYSSNMLIDDNLNTSWQEGEEDFGYGKTIAIQFEKTKLSYIVIYNGNQNSDNSYVNNNRIRSIKIIINGSSDTVELEDSIEPQVIKLTGIEDVTNVQLVIESVYEGTKFNDTCISEVELY